MPQVSRQLFGHLADGTTVEAVTLKGDGGFEVRLITYGAAIQSMFAPDRNGRVADIVLGRETAADYAEVRRFLGATIGRYANRIANGKFAIGGYSFDLPLNDAGGANALHGGLEGFDRKNWTITDLGDEPAPYITMTCESPDGEEGYPGTLRASLTYRVDGMTLSAAFTATTDKPTVVNLTNHSFFNLTGVEGSTGILDHRVTIMAGSYLPVSTTGIPLAGPCPVDGTPFDFRAPHRVGERIGVADRQLGIRQGYDHCYCLPGGTVDEPRLAARVEDPASGRVLELFTNQPGVQFYSGNFLDGSLTGKYGRMHNRYDALCLEPQVYPDTPNRPDFPSARLDPGQTYRHTTSYRLSTDRS
jgi:aldose 1-epimerase